MYSFEEAKNIFSQSKLELLTDVYKNGKEKYFTRCIICNHIWKTNLHNVKSGRGCPKCSIDSLKNKLKYSIEEIKQFYLDKNFEFLSNYYENSQKKYKAKCLKCDYVWESYPNHIIQGIGCANCYGNKKKTLEEVIAICENNNIKYLENTYNNSLKKTLVQCKNCNHKWKTSVSKIIEGRNCPKCFGNIPIEIKEVKQIYLSSNLEFLEDVYKNARTKYKTKCLKCDYKWTTSLDAVKHGKGCPRCNASKGEKILNKIVEKLLPKETNIIPHKMLVVNIPNIRTRIHVDCYFEYFNKKYAIEYNGIQHYEPVDFGYGKEIALKKFNEQKIRDEAVRNYCVENDINLFEIDGRIYREKILEAYLHEYISDILSGK